MTHTFKSFYRCMLACSVALMPALAWAKDPLSTPPDLKIPAMESADPAPGKRVRITLEKFKNTDIHHALYLPRDWQKGKTYPLIVEYAGNRYRQDPGTVESCKLGYGLSGGQGVIWVSLPFVDLKNKRNATTWWGDVQATVDYCKETVREVCTHFGGNSNALFIAGFSRGSIACNFIGLHDDEIAALWRGFICHSHYDGVRRWGYAGSDRMSAAVRLKRLGNRPQFVSHEASVKATKAYLAKAHPTGNFTFLPMSFPQHTDTWVLRDCPERRAVRAWFERVLKTTR